MLVPNATANNPWEIVFFMMSNVSDTHDFIHRNMYGISMRDFKQTKKNAVAIC